jgi:uncharacterized protein YycO
MKRRIIVICISIIFASSSILFGKGDYSFQEGDVLFQITQTKQSKTIQLATKSKYTHVGILFIISNEPFVLEAGSRVKYTRLENWINRGVNNYYLVKRLKGIMMEEKEVAKLKKIAKKYLGKQYDSFFNWSDEKLYCSELVWKIYKKGLNIELGTPKKMKEFDLKHPHVRDKLFETYGQKVPLEEIMISPGQIFKSKNLFKVYEENEAIN